MNRLFTTLVVLAMAAGVGAGWACHARLAPAQAAQAAHAFGLVTDLFLRLIRMVIAPLVFSTLVAGVARMEGAAAAGRIGLKAIVWFMAASLVSLAIGLVAARLLQPGAGMHLAPEAVSGAIAGAVAGSAGPPAAALTVEGFLTHLVPTSVVDAMARNEILQIVVFAVLAGAAMSALAERTAPLLALVEQIAEVMLAITGYVMRLAPVAIFAAMAAVVAEHGLGVLWTYLRFVASFYAGLAALWAVLLGAAVLVCGWRALRLVAAVREPLLLAFSTTSSEVAYPKLLERLQAFGVPARIAGFVLPLGYSFNLDGAMMYAAFAILFIGQAFGTPLSLAQQIVMLLVLMVSTKGLAGVPRAVMVVIAALLPYFHLPAAGLVLILAVDHFMDMGRAATNVFGNSVASLVVARWEGALEPESGRSPARRQKAATTAP